MPVPTQLTRPACWARGFESVASLPPSPDPGFRRFGRFSRGSEARWSRQSRSASRARSDAICRGGIWQAALKSRKAHNLKRIGGPQSATREPPSGASRFIGPSACPHHSADFNPIEQCLPSSSTCSGKLASRPSTLWNARGRLRDQLTEPETANATGGIQISPFASNSRSEYTGVHSCSPIARRADLTAAMPVQRFPRCRRSPEIGGGRR